MYALNSSVPRPTNIIFHSATPRMQRSNTRPARYLGGCVKRAAAGALRANEDVGVESTTCQHDEPAWLALRVLQGGPSGAHPGTVGGSTSTLSRLNLSVWYVAHVEYPHSRTSQPFTALRCERAEARVENPLWLHSCKADTKNSPRLPPPRPRPLVEDHQMGRRLRAATITREADHQKS